MLKSKIHRARVTGTCLLYNGSITLDPALIEAADLAPFEQVHVLDVNSGSRFVTYVVKGRKRGSGEVCINGAAARLAEPGDEVLILSYVEVDEKEIAKLKPRIITVDKRNRVK
jgi:aspartate 1-decarboxylase